MFSIIKLKPVFRETIWGGTRLKTYFGYDIPTENIGECLAVSALQNGDCEIENGEFKGKTLSWLYKNHRELFANIKNSTFPLLVKIIDAADNLSIQVHPDDSYANKVEYQQYGKTEAWYIIDADENAVLEIGHKANSKEELVQMIGKRDFKQLLNYTHIKPGDFFYIPSGTVHAICKNTLIYEVQQSSNLTYRLYDYDRIDKNTGKRRNLHTQKAIDVIIVPHEIGTTGALAVERGQGYEKTIYITNKYFSIFKYDIEDEINFSNESFLLCTVIKGNGKVGREEINKGDNFIVPSGYRDVTIIGNVSIIISTI